MGAPVTVADLAAWLGMSRSQVHRHLQTMLAHGLVLQPARGLWQAVINGAALDAVAKARDTVGMGKRQIDRIVNEKDEWAFRHPPEDA
jgi:DNA-binding IclR family transcriptional regulator